MPKIFNYSLFTTFVLISNLSLAENWDKKFFDPKETEGSIVLPMPCDGSMAFQVVKTGTRKPLEDKSIILGNDGGEQGFAEHATPNYIAGSFTEKNGERYYLIGKYEVSQLQYQAIMNESCPAPTMPLLQPATNISWFDAVLFSQKYNEWLMTNHKDKLPKEDGKVGFIRLPTNVEWEYAARGGVAVSDSEFREKTFPMPDGITKYAWFSGSKSANGKIQLIGRLSPNPIGVFDMLGNANEMVFDSFRMNKLDRYHGQSGGITVRGGSYLTAEEQISSAFRIENPYYDEQGKPFKAKDTGFRLALVMPIITSNNRIKELNQDWQNLGKDSNSQDKEIVSNLQQISQNVDNKELKDKLKALEDSLRASNQAKDEQRDQSIRSALQLGAFLCTDISDLHQRYEQVNKIKTYTCGIALENANTEEEKATAQKNCEVQTARADEGLAVRDFVLNYYADTLVETSANYAKNSVKDQLQAVLNKLKNQNKSNLNQYVNQYWQHLDEYYKNGKVNREQWLKSCTTVREQ